MLNFPALWDQKVPRDYEGKYLSFAEIQDKSKSLTAIGAAILASKVTEQQATEAKKRFVVF